MPKIIISVTNDLVSDNRVHKVATSLTKKGFEVLLVGRKLKNSPEIKRSYKTRRLKLLFNKSALFYAEYNFRLFLFLLLKKTNIYLSNDLDTLLPNFFAAKLKNKKLVYDSHELFTEVPELIERKRIRNVWLNIEKLCLPKVKNSYTVCQSIADFYKEKYSVDMGVVRNIPICKNYTFDTPINESRILIYQGAVNIGRGLEEIILAMKYLDDFELWILGDGDIKNELEKLITQENLKTKVKLLGRKKLEELPKYTVQADLGLSIEKNMGLNYYYALPNKIFDYIQSVVPILCADLPEMKKIVEKYNIGAVLKSHEPKKIAIQITSIFEDENKLSEWQKNLKLAKKELCWQNEEKILLKYFLKYESLL